MGWVRSVGSIKLYVSFAQCHLFYRALLHKRPIILSILLTKATSYTHSVFYSTYWNKWNREILLHQEKKIYKKNLIPTRKGNLSIPPHPLGGSPSRHVCKKATHWGWCYLRKTCSAFWGVSFLACFGLKRSKRKKGEEKKACEEAPGVALRGFFQSLICPPLQT